MIREQTRLGESGCALSGRGITDNPEAVSCQAKSNTGDLKRQPLTCISGWGKAFSAKDKVEALQTAFNLKNIERKEKKDGQFGLIYKACQVDDKKKEYLIKVNPEKDTSISAFSMEKGEICGLGFPPHHNIPTVYALLIYNKNSQHYIAIQSKGDISEETSRSCQVDCVVMEYIDGVNLDQALVRKRVKHGAKVAAAVLLQIGKAISHLHRHNIIHRDVKPGNIMFLPPSTFILIDLGMSKELEPTDVTYSPKGTPRFFSPNILSASGYGREVDHWSLAVTAIFLATGKSIVDLVSVTEEELATNVGYNRMEDSHKLIFRNFYGMTDGKWHYLILRKTQLIISALIILLPEPTSYYFQGIYPLDQQCTLITALAIACYSHEAQGLCCCC